MATCLDELIYIVLAALRFVYDRARTEHVARPFRKHGIFREALTVSNDLHGGLS